MSTEVCERVDVRTVRVIKVFLAPTGLSAYALRPLVDAALYHHEDKGNGRDWHRRKIFMEDNAISVLVLKPGDIDGLLDDGMSVRKLRRAIMIIITVDECHASQHCICEVCIVTYATRSLARVKAVEGLHCVHNFRLHLVDEMHAANCEQFGLGWWTGIGSRPRTCISPQTRCPFSFLLGRWECILAGKITSIKRSSDAYHVVKCRSR